MNESHAIVIFDGVCNLCDSAVQFIIKRDKVGYFKFIALQNSKVPELLDGKNDALKADSVILLEGGEVYVRSKAILKICAKLTWPWKIFSCLRIIPSFLLDPFYKIIAKSRYRLWGKKKECMLPSPEVKERFLS